MTPSGTLMTKASTVGTMPMRRDILAPHMRRVRMSRPSVGAEDVAVHQRGQQAVGADTGGRRIGADPRRENRDQPDDDDDRKADDREPVGRIGAPCLTRAIAPRALGRRRLRRRISNEWSGPISLADRAVTSFPAASGRGWRGYVGGEIGENEQGADDENPGRAPRERPARTRRHRSGARCRAS